MKWFRTRNKKAAKSSALILPPDSSFTSEGDANWKSRQYNLKSTGKHIFELRKIHPIEENLSLTSVFDFRRINLWKVGFRDYLYEQIKAFKQGKSTTFTTNDDKNDDTEADPYSQTSFIVPDDDDIPMPDEEQQLINPVEKHYGALSFFTKNLLTPFIFNCVMDSVERYYSNALKKTNFIIESEVKFGISAPGNS